MSVKLVPVAFKGVILLYDIWIDSRWIGSRRTISACRTFLNSPDAFTIGEVIAL